MADRAAMLRWIIGEYQNERLLEADRLENYRLERARTELAREVLLEHGEIGEADQLKLKIHDLDHKIQVGESYLARLDRLTGLYEASLEKTLEGSSES